jgi:glycine dehydrogenase
MVTYPSTHGVFEEAISDICDIIHQHGGQVYVDGANLNALVGTAQPGKFGADVSHLNLHKTFCIPHGGGGPGVGPVAVRSHLIPFLPSDPLSPSSGIGPVSAANFGSASICAIPWVYISMMSADGLLQATADAILSANYVARRLNSSYPVLYTGANNTIAHECILNVGEVIKGSGLSIDDIAKRLMDYGLHAPTMSFPVAGTFMIEPTESEDIAELDRFIAAMKAIRAEIDQIIKGEVMVEGSALRNAPHTIEAVLDRNWDRAYSRATGATPGSREGLISGELIGTRGKYFPTVGRVDGVHGDRNLICACTPVAEYAE